MNLQDYNGHDGQHCFLDANPFTWHELRMCKREDASGGSVFDFAFRPIHEDAEEGQWIQCADSVLPFRGFRGTRIALGLKQGGGRRKHSEITFKGLSVVEGDCS